MMNASVGRNRHASRRSSRGGGSGYRSSLDKSALERAYAHAPFGPPLRQPTESVSLDALVFDKACCHTLLRPAHGDRKRSSVCGKLAFEGLCPQKPFAPPWDKSNKTIMSALDVASKEEDSCSGRKERVSSMPRTPSAKRTLHSGRSARSLHNIPPRARTHKVDFGLVTPPRSLHDIPPRARTHKVDFGLVTPPRKTPLPGSFPCPTDGRPPLWSPPTDDSPRLPRFRNRLRSRPVNNEIDHEPLAWLDMSSPPLSTSLCSSRIRAQHAELMEEVDMDVTLGKQNREESLIAALAFEQSWNE